MTPCCVHSDRPAAKGRRYCDLCVDRLRRGYEALDGDELPDGADVARAKPEPGKFMRYYVRASR